MHAYLVHIQYLGFRFHGWQKQPNVKTVELMLEKTLAHLLGQDRFRIMGASRTDAMVSAAGALVQIFTQAPLDCKPFLKALNQNLPNDIRVLELAPADPDLNIRQNPGVKEYLYLFAFGEKIHPFCASLLSGFTEKLDIDLMIQGASLFEGEHNFIQYCTQPREKTRVTRRIHLSRIHNQTPFTASFFPEQVWVFQVRARGFLRHQVRLMMGQLIELGRHATTLEALEASLTGENRAPFSYIAPASGLILNRIDTEGRRA